MLLDDINRIKHMLDAAHEAKLFMKDIKLEDLSEDRKTTQAVIRSIEIIGEAAVHLSEDFKMSYPEIPWKQIVGMRNWLIHAYFDIDYDHVWNTVYQDLPVLIPQLEKLLDELQRKP